MKFPQSTQPHIRRKFFEAESGDCDFRDWILRKIRHLFMYEKVAWSRSPEERLKIRREKEVPIIDEIIRAVKDRLINGKILPKSKFRIALGYICGLIPHLKTLTNKSAQINLKRNEFQVYYKSEQIEAGSTKKFFIFLPSGCCLF